MPLEILLPLVFFALFFSLIHRDATKLRKSGYSIKPTKITIQSILISICGWLLATPVSFVVFKDLDGTSGLIIMLVVVFVLPLSYYLLLRKKGGISDPPINPGNSSIESGISWAEFLIYFIAAGLILVLLYILILLPLLT